MEDAQHLMYLDRRDEKIELVRAALEQAILCVEQVQTLAPDGQCVATHADPQQAVPVGLVLETLLEQHRTVALATELEQLVQAAMLAQRRGESLPPAVRFSVEQLYEGLFIEPKESSDGAA